MENKSNQEIIDDLIRVVNSDSEVVLSNKERLLIVARLNHLDSVEQMLEYYKEENGRLRTKCQNLTAQLNVQGI